MHNMDTNFFNVSLSGNKIKSGSRIKELKEMSEEKIVNILEKLDDKLTFKLHCEVIGAIEDTIDYLKKEHKNIEDLTEQEIVNIVINNI